MFQSPIFYMRSSDFDKNGNLKNNFLQKKITIVFIHADFCIYCTHAKPEFQKAALENKYPNTIFFGAIQADGNLNEERQCNEIFDKICHFEGFPEYAIFIDGKPSFVKMTGRDKQTILDTLYSILN